MTHSVRPLPGNFSRLFFPASYAEFCWIFSEVFLRAYDLSCSVLRRVPVSAGLDPLPVSVDLGAGAGEPGDVAEAGGLEPMREWPELLGEYDGVTTETRRGVLERLTLEVAIDQRDVLRSIAESLASLVSHFGESVAE